MMHSPIFKDESKLDIGYIPDSLPNREKHLQKLKDHYTGTLNNGICRHILLIGDVGTGKTVTAKLFCQLSSKEARKLGKNIEWARINCMDNIPSTTILSALFKKLRIYSPARGFSEGEMLESLKRYLERKKTHLILILDDVDTHIKKYGSKFIYSLTRFNEDFNIKGYEGISLILISHENILNRFDSATISSFGHTKIEFNRYSWKELTEIIRQRVNLAFYNDRVDDESISLIADIASIWGDARFAIELLWKAGKAAESQGENIVTPEHIRAAKAETYSIITESKLKYLKKQEKLVLLSIARKLRKSGSAYLRTGDLINAYHIICEEYGEKARGGRRILDYMKHLHSYGFIDLKISEKGERGKTHLISIPDIPTQVVEEKLEELLQLD